MHGTTVKMSSAYIFFVLHFDRRWLTLKPKHVDAL